MNNINIFKHIKEEIESKRTDGDQVKRYNEYEMSKSILSEFVKTNLSTTLKDNSKMYWRDYLVLLKIVRNDPNYINNIPVKNKWYDIIIKRAYLIYRKLYLNGNNTGNK